MTDQNPANWGIIGNAETVNFLRRAVERGNPAHAYLLIGPSGVGKTTLARVFARQLLGTDRLEAHPGYTLVERSEDPKTKKMREQIAIAQVHELRGVLARTALGGGRKAAVLIGADRLGREAANALLKTLEEPAGDTVLVLTADSLDDVLPTVQSRCQVLRLSRMSTQALQSALVARGVSVTRALTAAAISGGRPGTALRLTEDDEALKELSVQRRELLGLADLRVGQRWAAIENFLPKKLSFNESGDRAREFLDLAAELLRDALLIDQGLPEQMTHVDLKREIADWLAKLGSGTVLAAVDRLASARTRLEANVNPRSVLEDFVLVFERDGTCFGNDR